MLFCSFQTGLQVFLVVIAVLSVPVLLLGKPLYLYWLQNGSRRLGMYRVRILKCMSACERVQNISKYLFCGCKYADLMSCPVCPQGYERVRRNSEEELYLMRTHDMEEGSSHSELSSSGEHQTEEVSAAEHLHIKPLILNVRLIMNVFWFLSVMLSFVFCCRNSLTWQMNSCIRPSIL